MSENRYQRTRDDHNAELAEDYVELVDELRREYGVARITDIAIHMHVSHASASKVLQRLAREGWVTLPPRRGVLLTEKGEELAKFARDRHVTVVAFLRKIGVPEKAAETDAEGIEHHVGQVTLDAIRRFLSD